MDRGEFRLRADRDPPGAVVAKTSTQPKSVDLHTDYRQITASIALCGALTAGLA